MLPKFSSRAFLAPMAGVSDPALRLQCKKMGAGLVVTEFTNIISNTIIQNYTNKQHDGFLGDSYIGAWVNLGAGTVNSNLTNLYGPIKVQLFDKIIDTGQTFLGMIVGDHTKTAINTKITTGSIVGFACNILLTTTPPKFTPSFSWYSDNVTRACDITRELQVAKRMMARRNKKMTRNGEKVFKTIFALTETERKIYDN